MGMRSIVCSLVGIAGLAGLTLAWAENKPTPRPAAAAAQKKPAAETPRSRPAGGATSDAKGIEQQIRESADAFAKAYHARDAKGIAAGFTENAEFRLEDGTPLRGREAIADHFIQIFDAQPDSKIHIAVESIEIIAPDLVLEEGTISTIVPPVTVPQQSRYVALHSRQAGGWLIARARDFPTETPAATASDATLGELEWLTGDWVEETEGAQIFTACKWIDGHRFLLEEFTIRLAGDVTVSGSTRIGWDPLRRQIRSWTFDSHGGFSEGWWTRTGDTWTITSRGATGTGEASSGTTVVRRIDSATMSWESHDRVAGGRIESDRGPILIKRRPPAPAE